MNSHERILLKLDEMKRDLKELDDLLPGTEQDYMANLSDRRACEKTIELAIESVIDVMAMLVSHLKLGVPKDEDDIITILEKKKVLSTKLSAKVREMKGFRNILVRELPRVFPALPQYTFSPFRQLPRPQSDENIPRSRIKIYRSGIQYALHLRVSLRLNLAKCSVRALAS